MMLAYPAPIYVHGRFATDDESGTLYLVLGVISVVAVFGCQLYREQQNGLGIKKMPDMNLSRIEAGDIAAYVS
jgi:hypothetical protein